MCNSSWKLEWCWRATFCGSCSTWCHANVIALNMAMLGKVAMMLDCHVSRRGNIWWNWQSKCCWTNCCLPMFQFGLLASICLKHSLEYVGQHCGVPYPNRAFKPYDLGFSKFIPESEGTSVCKWWFAVDRSRYVVVCVMVASWVAGF